MTILKNGKVFAERRDWGGTIALFLGRDQNGAFYAAQPLSLEKHKEGELAEPCVEVDLRTAQALMDELWHAGVRPTQGSGSAGQLAATEKHLQDMRRLVFETKGLP